MLASMLWCAHTVAPVRAQRFANVLVPHLVDALVFSVLELTLGRCDFRGGNELVLEEFVQKVLERLAVEFFPQLEAFCDVPVVGLFRTRPDAKVDIRIPCGFVRKRAEKTC